MRTRTYCYPTTRNTESTWGRRVPKSPRMRHARAAYLLERSSIGGKDSVGGLSVYYRWGGALRGPLPDSCYQTPINDKLRSYSNSPVVLRLWIKNKIPLNSEH